MAERARSFVASFIWAGLAAGAAGLAASAATDTEWLLVVAAVAGATGGGTLGQLRRGASPDES